MRCQATEPADGYADPVDDSGPHERIVVAALQQQLAGIITDFQLPAGQREELRGDDPATADELGLLRHAQPARAADDESADKAEEGGGRFGTREILLPTGRLAPVERLGRSHIHDAMPPQSLHLQVAERKIREKDVPVSGALPADLGQRARSENVVAAEEPAELAVGLDDRFEDVAIDARTLVALD